MHKLHTVVLNQDGDFIDTEDREKNSEVFASLVPFLDDKSLNLIIRDAKNDGRAAIKILREHYIGCSKPRIISSYVPIASLHH